MTISLVSPHSSDVSSETIEGVDPLEYAPPVSVNNLDPLNVEYISPDMFDEFHSFDYVTCGSSVIEEIFPAPSGSVPDFLLP